MQRLEHGKVSKWLSAAALKIPERLPGDALRSSAGAELAQLEATKQRFQQRAFARRDCAVVDDFG